MRKWRSEIGLDSDLLSDSTRQVALAYGAATDPAQPKAARVSVLIDSKGKVAKTYTDVDAAQHPAEALRDMLALHN